MTDTMVNITDKIKESAFHVYNWYIILIEFLFIGLRRRCGGRKVRLYRCPFKQNLVANV